MADDIDLLSMVDQLGADPFAEGGALDDAMDGGLGGGLDGGGGGGGGGAGEHEHEHGVAQEILHQVMSTLHGDSLDEIAAHLGRGSSCTSLDAATTGARAAADFLRVAREAGLVGLCDALAFCGLDEELPALCAAGLTVLAPTDAAFAHLARRTPAG